MSGFTHLRVIGLAGALTLLPGVVQAQQDWDFSGFASLGAGRVSKENLTFIDSNGDWSFGSDTMLGLQAIYEPLDRLSLTGQWVLRGYTFDGDKEFDSEIEWLFLSYELTSDLRLRLGRLRTPHYLFSETLEIGYAYPWVRPPVDMYVFYLEPFSHFDGADLSLQHNFGEVEAEFKAFYGQMNAEFLGIDIDISRSIGVVASARLNDFTLRYGANTNRASLTLPDADILINGFELAQSVAPVFSGLGDYFYAKDQDYQYHGIGLQWEHDEWSITTEKFLFLGPEKQFSFDSRGWYISISRQFGDWMPYVVNGKYTTRMAPKIIGDIENTYNAYPEGGSFLVGGADYGGLIDLLRSAAIYKVNERNVGQRSHTIGVRWDFHPQADLKFELQYFDFLDNSTGHMLPVDNNDKPSDAVVTTIVMDVVF